MQSWLAPALVAAGRLKNLLNEVLKVIMLERGHDIKHGKDYEASNKPVWEYPHRGGRTQQMIEDYPVLKRDYPLNERNLHWWVNDKDMSLYGNKTV